MPSQTANENARACQWSGAVLEIRRPARQTLPLVFASPHSGTDYPPEFMAASRLDRRTLRRSEDSFVDRIYADVPDIGAPLLLAHFPRAYIDPNREPYELDQEMFAEPLPAYARHQSPRVFAGLGTIARVVASGEEIYQDKLRLSDAEVRIAQLYRPYHAALRDLIAATKARFGYCVLVDCHSMPSIGGPLEADSGKERVDYVLGDCFGTACAAGLTDAAENYLRGHGFAVVRNAPYAGGYTTQHYGRPPQGVHALQIEINRELYMDEASYRPTAGLQRLATLTAGFAKALAGVPIRPPRAVRAG